jgi:cytochrome P450/NADPH-cytochrome P450 reductase
LTFSGHETTSGLLSFLFSFLLANPAKYQAAQNEVDRVIGKNQITVDHMSKLPYITACLRETLRLCPTAPAISLHSIPGKTTEDVSLCNGKYKIGPEQVVTALFQKCHRDPTLYGNDAEEFKPERILDEEFRKLPKNAWKVS